ncbi:MAG: hypothetical protein PHF41_13715 [Massilibacteroides sp.]|nr:hypothetical protein [Massilibacteroides sp.]
MRDMFLFFSEPRKLNKRQAGYIPQAAAYREPDGGCAMIFPCAGEGDWISA